MSDSSPETSRSSENVRVMIRTRPMNDTERNRGDRQVVFMSPENPKSMEVVSQSGAGKEMIRTFAFDHCLHEQMSQEQVFHHTGVTSLLESAVEGYSATVFAYGQTGAGKTFSMSGLEEKLENAEFERLSDPSDGIIPRSIHYLFNHVSRQTSAKYSIRASYCEIYNEQVYDLLNATSKMLAVRWNDTNGFFVQNLLVVRCDSLDDIMAVVAEGHRNRRVDSHALNKDSSRSHSILTVYVDSEHVNAQDGHSVVKFGKISFVDLAGSERLKESKSSNMGETSSINKSLFALGKVISALGESNSNFVPYRDSKLTKLLMDSLGGNSLTIMLACVSPSSFYLDETLSTLNYATRANNIRNKPTIQVDPKEQFINSLREEIQRLRVENTFLKGQFNHHRDDDPLPSPRLPSRPTRAPHHLPPFKDRPTTPRILKTPRQVNQDEFQVVLKQYQDQLNHVQEDNTNLRTHAGDLEHSMQSIMNENDTLRSKIEHLEHVFINNQNQSPNWGNVQDEIQVRDEECNRLRSIIDGMDRERQMMAQRIDALEHAAPTDTRQLNDRINYLQQREKDLMKALARRSRAAQSLY